MALLHSRKNAASAGPGAAGRKRWAIEEIATLAGELRGGSFFAAVEAQNLLCANATLDDPASIR